MTRLKQALEMLSEGRHSEARAELEAIVGHPQDPGHLKARFMLGALLIRLGEAELGLSHLRAFPPSGELGEAAALVAGNACIDVRQYNDAAAWLRQAIAIRPSAPAWCLLHSALFRGGASEEESLECLKQAIRTDPDYEEAHANLAMRYRLTGRWEEAKAHVDRALELDTEYGFALAEACALSIRTHPEEAVQLGRRATQADPSHFWSWVYLAIAQWAVGENDNADQSYRTARSLHPGDALSMRLHAEFIKKALKDDEAATRLMELAIALNPNSDEALLGWVASPDPEAKSDN